MLFDIQPDSTVPIYEQIVSQVIFGIADGTLEPGTLIPSVRELAGALLINPNTVARAYQELERRGVIAAKRGLGMEVAEEGPKVARLERQRIVRDRVRAALREAVQALPTEEVRRVVAEELAHVNGQSTSRGKR